MNNNDTSIHDLALYATVLLSFLKFIGFIEWPWIVVWSPVIVLIPFAVFSFVLAFAVGWFTTRK